MPAPSQVTTIVESTNDTLAGMTLTKLNPLSMLPTCVASRFVEALDEAAEGDNTASVDPVDVASVPYVSLAEGRAVSLLAAEQAKERERKRQQPHGRYPKPHFPQISHDLALPSALYMFQWIHGRVWSDVCACVRVQPDRYPQAHAAG